MEAGWFFRSCIPGVLLWVVLYVAQVWLWVATARAYRALGGNWIVLSSKEEFARYERLDEDLLRRHIIHGFWGVLWLVLMWAATRELIPSAVYACALGGPILGGLSGVQQNLRALYNFRALPGGGAKGKIFYPRRTRLRQSALDRLLHSLGFLVLAGLLHSWFFVGGSVYCLWHAQELRKRARRNDPQPAMTSQNSPSQP